MPTPQKAVMLALCVCVLAAVAQSAVVTQYSFEDNLLDTAAGGAVADDLSEVSGTASYAAGVVGQAVVFDQAAGLKLLEAADSADDVAEFSSWTIELFVNTTTLSAGFNRLVLKWDDGVPDFDDFSYHVSIHNGGLDLFVSSDGTSGGSTNPIVGGPATNVADDGKWHHLAVVNDSTDAVLGLKAYVDGVNVYTGAGIAVFDGSDVLGLGTFRGGGQGFSGLMDEVLFHDVAVDQAYIDSRVALIPFPEMLVGVYYYPWHGPEVGGHGFTNTLRDHLVSVQQPGLGHYSNYDSAVTATHIQQSIRGNIDFWACSWWGPGSFVDNALKNYILPHPSASQMKYAIMYETEGRGGHANLQTDFAYLQTHYFNHPYYLKIDDRPVVFIYLTRAYFNSSEADQALADLRAAYPDVYLVGDEIFGPGYSASNAAQWDAVTAYDVYGQSLGGGGSTSAALNYLKNTYSDAKTAANSVGVGLIPAAVPGFNDRGVRSGHNAAPRYLTDDPQSVEGDLFEAMLRDVVVPSVDPLAQNMIMVTSFNEWHEDTQIEPTTGTAGTTSSDDSATGTDYTQGYSYTDYGYLYLDILRQETQGAIDPGSDCNNDEIPDELQDATPVDSSFLSFDGIDDLITVPDDTSINFIGKSMTFEFWARRSSNTDEDRVLNSNSMFVTFNNGKIYFWFRFGDSLEVINAATDLVGVWNHWAGTYNQASGEMIVYLNGNPIGQESSVTGMTQSSDWGLGGHSAGSSLNFNGGLDEIRLWNDVRTQAEIQNNMSSPLVGNEANLVAYWAMNEDAGTSVGDSSPNSNTGTFVNYPQWFIGVADSDSDGINNGCDLLEGCNDMADLYSDLVINLPDLALLAENWLCISNCTADVDGDGDTDLDDLLVMAANWLCAGKE